VAMEPPTNDTPCHCTCTCPAVKAWPPIPTLCTTRLCSAPVGRLPLSSNERVGASGVLVHRIKSCLILFQPCLPLLASLFWKGLLFAQVNPLLQVEKLSPGVVEQCPESTQLVR
jgi:hypothetical protein